LLFGITDVGTRLIRLGCLPGCPDEAAETASGGPTARTPAQRVVDQQAYKRLVVISRYSELWGFNKANLRAIVEQALHLAELNQYATVARVAITAASAWTLHTVSATNSGVKTASATYAKSVKLLCEFAAAPESQQPGGFVVPINRYVAGTFMRAEKARPKRTGNRPGADDADASGSECDGDGHAHGGGGGDADGDEDLIAEGDGGGGGGATRGQGKLDGSDRRRPGGHPPAASSDDRGRSPAAGSGPHRLHVSFSDAVAVDGEASSAPSPARRFQTVGRTVVKMHQSAMANVCQDFNQLWTACGCSECARSDVKAFESVGPYSAANLLVSETQRNRTLENTESGVAKATGLRDPTLTDKDPRALIETLLLSPTNSKQMHKALLLADLFVLSFSLEARGATTRGLEWSDYAVRRFPAMFGTGGDSVYMLCTYVSATKTGEGGAYCSVSIAHVDPWLCPLGAVADALVTDCHREGQDLLTPPVYFFSQLQPDRCRASGDGGEAQVLLGVGVRPQQPSMAYMAAVPRNARRAFQVDVIQFSPRQPEESGGRSRNQRQGP